jgi:hypothetical protein
MHRHRIVAVVWLLVCAGCGHDDAAPPIPMTPTVADTIEYRVTGNVGGSPVLIKYTNSIDGLSVIPADALPYLATVQSTDTTLYVFLEASTNAVAAVGVTPLLQVQITINGRVFRDAYATGFGPIVATASGTWRR